MAFLGGLFGGRRRNDTAGGSNTEVLTSKSSNYFDANQVQKLDQYSVWQLIAKVRDLNNPYQFKYGEYDLMSDDAIIQAALEMYSDDATQMDPSSGKIVQIESEDKDLASDLNNLLDSLEVENRIWGWAHDLAKYGDLYEKVHTDDNNTKMKLEDMPDPALINDLFSNGERINFAVRIDTECPNKVPRHSRTNEYDFEMYDKHSFIHFMVRKCTKHDTFELQLDEIDKETGEPKILEYQVVRGVSLLERVRSIYRVLQLLEDSLLAARIAKSDFIRVFNVEVGDSTPGQTTDVVNTVKNMFDAKASYDVNSGRYVSNKNFRPYADPIFNPVRNGKGNITHEDIGGDFEVKAIVDIDYFNNKFFAGLTIPKAFLGFEDSLPVGSDGDTLAQLDIRYSRLVKRIVKALIIGVEDICNRYLIMRGRDSEIGKFKVIMQMPSAAEESARIADLENRINAVNSITASITENFGEYINVPKVYNLLFDKIVKFPEIKEKLQEELEAAAKLAEKNKKSDGTYDYGSEDDPMGNINTQIRSFNKNGLSSGRNQPTFIYPDDDGEERQSVSTSAEVSLI